MSARIHPTAVVDPAAVIGEGCEIGPYCIVGPQVRLGDGVRLMAHVVIDGVTELGDGCVAHPFAAIGGEPQDFSYKGEPTQVVIGPRVVLREHVTVHRGTARSRGVTRIGADTYLMAQAHVGHDCIVGEKVLLSHAATLGGHVVLGDQVIVGGLAAIHQFARVGRGAFVGGLAALVDDVIPYGSAYGNHAKLAGLNIVGLKRRGYTRPQIHALRQAYQQLFAGEGLFQDRLEAVAEAFAQDPQVSEIVAFIREGAKRPLCLPER